MWWTSNFWAAMYVLALIEFLECNESRLQNPFLVLIGIFIFKSVFIHQIASISSLLLYYQQEHCSYIIHIVKFPTVNTHTTPVIYSHSRDTWIILPRYLRNKPTRSNIVRLAGTSIKSNVPYSSTGPYVFTVVLNVHACINANIPWPHRSVFKRRSLGAQYRAPLWLYAQEHKAASVQRDQALGNGLCCSRFMTLCGLCCSRVYDLVYTCFECLLKYALCLRWISAPYFFATNTPNLLKKWQWVIEQKQLDVAVKLLSVISSEQLK